MPTVAPIAFWNTRAAVVLAAVALFAATIVFYCPTNWFLTFVILLTDGLPTLAWIAAAAALGSVLLQRFHVRSNPLLHLSTASALGLGIWGLIALGLGLAGLLNRGTALALPLTSAALFLVRQLRKPPSSASSPPFVARRDVFARWLCAPAGFSWWWLVPVVSLATAALAACVMPGDLWKPLDPHPYDVLSYHLQVPREWFEAGRIFPLHHNVFSYFPFNVEIQFLLLMHATGGPWAAMYRCQLLNVGYAMLMILAIAGSASAESPPPPDGKPVSPAAPVFAAAIVSCVPWVIMLASVAYVESALMLYTALTVIWAIRSLPSSKPSSTNAAAARFDARALILSGLFAGFAAGVKITAVPMLIAAVPLALLLIARFSRRLRLPLKSVLLACAVFLIAAAATLGPWLIRTTAWSGGNPLFPVAMHVLGAGHFSPTQVQRFSIAHSPTPWQRPPLARLGITWTELLANIQYGYVLWPAAALALLARRRDPATAVLLVTAAVTFIVWIGFTHLLGRFLIMLIPIAGLLLARMNWGRAWPVAGTCVLAAATLGWFGVFPRLTSTTRDPLRCHLVGLEDLSLFIPAELNLPANADKQVVLVGDAAAFLYQIPMARLHYRTVFDLPGNAPNPIAAWAPAAAAGNPHWLLVINPLEIARLHATYYAVPALPANWAAHELPFVLRGDQVVP